MKRYLTSYSRETLTVRDRKTGQTKRITHTDKQTADVIQDAIKQTNYNLTTKRPEIVKKSISEVQSWLNDVSKKSRTEWGWIQPDKINWEQPKKDLKKDKETELVTRLNNILKGI